jgi:hypothetical protein
MGALHQTLYIIIVCMCQELKPSSPDACFSKLCMLSVGGGGVGGERHSGETLVKELVQFANEHVDGSKCSSALAKEYFCLPPFYCLFSSSTYHGSTVYTPVLQATILLPVLQFYLPQISASCSPSHHSTACSRVLPTTDLPSVLLFSSHHSTACSPVLPTTDLPSVLLFS